MKYLNTQTFGERHPGLNGFINPKNLYHFFLGRDGKIYGMPVKSEHGKTIELARKRLVECYPEGK